SQDPLNPGEELTSSLHDWYLSHRTPFNPSSLNNILDNGLKSRPDSVLAARELELFGRSGTVYSALRHKQYGIDNIKNTRFGEIEILINPSRIVNKTTWFPQDTGLHRYQSLEEIREDHGWKGLHFRQLNSVSPKANLMENYEGSAGYVEAQTHAPILPSDISAIRIGSNLASPDELYKRHGNSLLDFIRTALSKNIKVIGDFSPQFLKVAESVGININKGLSDGITKSADEPIKAISEVVHQTIEKATEGLVKVSEIHQPNPAPIKQISEKPNSFESHQKLLDEINRKLAALQGKGKDVGSGLSKGINSSLGDVESSSEKLADTVIDTVEKKLEIQSPSKWGIRIGRFVGEGFTKGLEFLEGGNNGIIPIFIKVMNDIKSAVENGEITSSAEDFKNRLSQGFSQGLESVPGFKEAKQRFEGYKTFLKEIANPSTFAALGEGLANGIVAAKELFVDFLKIPEKLVEGFNQAKVAFDSFVEGMNKVQKFGEIMDFLKSSIGNVVKVLGLLVVGKIILDLAPASIEVATSFENLERRIRFTSGSISEGAKNIAFLRSEAKRLNVSLSQTLESGSKFFQATKDTPIEGYQSRQVVSAVTQASAVYGLDLDNQQRAFTALEQMSGKAVVSQEELRQQLAEAIPNASQVAANAYGTTTQSMNQLLSTGRVLAEDFLPKFAQQLKAQTSSGVGDAVNSSVAITNKFNNSLTELQESIGKTLLPFKNFSLGIFASGIDLVTNNFQLLQNVLLITLIKLGSPVWMMFGAYLKEIAFSGNLVKGALLGMGQSIATFAKEMFILSMAMKAIDEIMMNFKDNSGAIGEQTRNVTQSINEQRKILNQQASVTKTDDFSAFRERFSLNPFDNSTKKLKKQIEDSAKRTLEGRENTKNLLDASNSPAMQGAIREIQAIDKSLDLIKMKRRAVIANNPDNIQELRKLQSQEKELSQKREKPLELFGGNKGNLDKQVETLKTYLEYWEELKKNPKLYQSEIEQINKIISTTKDDLAIVTAEQEKMVKAIKNSLTEMQKFAIEIRNIEAKFNDVRQARDTILSLQKFNLFNYATNGVIQPGQVEYTNNLLTQVDLVSKIADNLKQVREMSAQLNINGLDDVLKSQGLNKDTGIDTLKAAQERAIDGSKEKEILTSFIEVKKMQVQTVDMQQQLSEQKYNVTQSLRQQTKQVADYYRTAVREAQAVSSEFQKAQKTLENSRMQNKLREALIGAGDNIYTQFIEGIINIISQTTEIQKQQFEARKQQIDYENNIQDI
ncbi:MAG: tape measure protein, partial [Microcystis panniformis]